MSAVILSPTMDAVMGPVVPPDTSDAVVSASHRLALSRSRLHQAVDIASSGKTSDDPFATARSATGLARGLASGALHDWWAHHPLRVVTDVTADAAKTLVQPVAQRHPVALVAGAAAVGAILVWSQPWRWLLTPALLAGLLPKVISHVVNSKSPRVGSRTPHA